MFKTFALLAIVAVASADPVVDGVLTPAIIQDGIVVAQPQQLVVASPQLYAPAGLIGARLIQGPVGIPVTGKSIGIGLGGGISVGAGKTLVNVGNGLVVPGLGLGLNAGINVGAGKTVYGPGGIILRRPGLGLGLGIRAGLGIGIGKAIPAYGWGYLG